jgi:hypothetical protein
MKEKTIQLKLDIGNLIFFNKCRWLCFGITLIEALICIKFIDGAYTDNPTPIYIWVPWTIVLTILIGTYLRLRFGSRKTKKFLDAPPSKKGKQTPNVNKKN